MWMLCSSPTLPFASSSTQIQRRPLNSVRKPSRTLPNTATCSLSLMCHFRESGMCEKKGITTGGFQWNTCVNDALKQEERQSQGEKNMQTNEKQEAVSLLKSLETGDPKPLDYIKPSKYIQHNL